jgi:hypothetical protein
VIHSAVRPRKRSHNTPIALAGLGALAVLASISGGASNAPPVEAASSSSDAPSVDPQAIRSVDFGDVAQPGEACSNGLRFAPPGQIPVRGGRSQVLDLAQLTQLVVDPDVAYSDLDGDGAEEAVVHVTCTFGANGTEDSVDVWSLEGDEPVQLASLDAPPETLDSDLPPTVQSVGASDGRVVVNWSSFSEGTPQCCPDEQVRASYQLDDDELSTVGDLVTRALGQS